MRSLVRFEMHTAYVKDQIFAQVKILGITVEVDEGAVEGSDVGKILGITVFFLELSSETSMALKCWS